jgi:hypothetical protein
VFSSFPSASDTWQVVARCNLVLVSCSMTFTAYAICSQ